MLKPGGVIVVATPNMGSFWRRSLGHYWPSFKIPEHILYFTKQTLTTAMKNAHYNHIQSIPFPHAFPLSLIAGKLKIPLPSIAQQINLWLPNIMVTLYSIAHE